MFEETAGGAGAWGEGLSSTEECDSDDELADVKRDEYKRILGQRDFITRVFKKQPPSRIMCFALSATETRVDILKILREWKQSGLSMLQDDQKGLVMRFEILPVNREPLSPHPPPRKKSDVIVRWML